MIGWLNERNLRLFVRVYSNPGMKSIHFYSQEILGSKTRNRENMSLFWDNAIKNPERRGLEGTKKD